MGNLCVKDTSPEAVADTKIAAEIEKDKVVQQSLLKVLLLGAGESGKSTIFKQMKILHKKGYDAQECARFKEIIFGNILVSIRTLITAMQDNNFSFSTDEAKSYAEEIAKISEQQVILSAGQLFTPDMAKKIKAVWKDAGIKQALALRSKIMLNDSADYYLNDIDRIAKPDFAPTQQDVLCSRVKTVGIVEMEFEYEKRKLKMVDVGGQRNERRKWIHCFDDVTAIIFVASLSEYDQTLVEDPTQNRMHESVKLFEEICNCRYFRNTSIILFFNKDDLFRKKIETVDLNVAYPDYTGGCNYNNALSYIRNKYIDAAKKKGTASKRQLMEKVTQATDTSNIKTVFEGVKSIILMGNIIGSGM